MSYSEIILNRLLDKYEKSLHAQGQGLSKRRVLLKTDRGDIPEYDYHNVDIRDEFNEAVRALENAGIILSTWGRTGFVLAEIWLNLGQVDQAYRFIGRESKEYICERFIQALTELKNECETPWILSFADDQVNEIRRLRRLGPLCKRDYSEIGDLLTALRAFNKLRGESTSMRAFSIKCYHDSKYFERHVKDFFLSVAKKYEPSLKASEDESELGWREQLMMIGIFARPELYELSGNIVIQLKYGRADLSVFGDLGLALPDTLINDILDIKMENIRQVIFIENKTCYDEYLLKHKRYDELVIYHGGFISPKKSKFLRIILRCAQVDSAFYFWGDIDIGGFRMYCQLKEYCERLLPWKMGAYEVKRYSATGMRRPDAYFVKMEALKTDPCFIEFHAAIEACFHYSVTIEQESMLDSLME